MESRLSERTIMKEISNERLQELTNDVAKMQVAYYRADIDLQEKYALASALLEVREKLAKLQEQVRWIPVDECEAVTGKLYYVINGGTQSSAVAIPDLGRIRWYHSASVEFTNVTHVIDPEKMPLPVPPEGVTE
jgi:hypothetical protein